MERKQIARPDMIAPLVEADPTLAPVWEDFRREWSGEAEPPLYIFLGQVARRLIGDLASGDTGRFPAVFAVVEAWHADGDEDVRTAAAIGLLEDLQNVSLHGSTQPAEFEPWLLPRSRRWWDKLNRLWSEGPSIAAR